MSIAIADSTMVAIRKKVRRLTASASESALATSDIDQYVNTFYSQDFPYGIKIDQMRSVYTFFTEPYRDRYPIDVNYNQGIRAPVYVDGIQGSLFKDRQQFYNVWPRFPTQFQESDGEAAKSGVILGAQTTNPVRIVSDRHGLVTGETIVISGVVGMTELNGNTYTVTVENRIFFTLNGINGTAFTPYVSGGVWETTDIDVSFVIPGPFLSREVVIGGVDTTGSPISINDDGNGILQYLLPNPVVSVPISTAVYPLGTIPSELEGLPIPGMPNQNTFNPGLNKKINIGTIDYVTGQFDFNLINGVELEPGTYYTVRVSQYQPGRPYNLLFWNNELTVRPVPKEIHKIEVETFLTPVQFMEETNIPILNQWWQYIAIGAAIKVLEDRQDMEGVANLSVLFDRQEALVLERQGVEEIFQPNITIFNSSDVALGGVNGYGYY